MALQTKNRTPVVLSKESGWIHRDFQKEKLRVRERYWRPVEVLPPSFGTSSEEGDLWIIPDGVAWRKYLPLLTSLVERNFCKLILLESAVELLDYRSMSPSIPIHNTNTNSSNTDHDHQGEIPTWIPETPAPQERSKIQKLLQMYPNRVISFCDLSIREQDHDEWDMMGYSTMSIPIRSQHALVRAGRILQEHDDNNNEKEIMILSTDAEFVAQFPSEDGVDLILIHNLMERLLNADTNPLSNNVEINNNNNLDSLLELKDRCEENYRIRNVMRGEAEKSLEEAVKEHLSEEQVQEGLRNKTLLKGRLNVTKQNPREASVVVAGSDPYFINQQLRHFNRALNQDTVIIQPLPQAEWGRPVGKRRLVHHRDDEDDDGRLVHVDLTPPVPSARVVAIAAPARRTFVATVVDVPMNDESACLVIPMDIRIPKIRIRSSGWKRFIGNRLLVQVDAWDVGSNYPAGHCVEILGPIADMETEIAALLHENQLHLEPFSASALASLPPKGHDWEIPSEALQGRLDLSSSHRIFSVDPPGCQDIDDTMHARVLPNGDIEVGVHIADVTYFVPHNSALDLEAQIRGTTFYLVDRRFDMLPSLLSSDLCSLHGDTDRLAVSTIWTMSSDLKEVKSFWYGRTVIHNCQAMTYDQAHNILHDKPPDDKAKPKPPPLTAGAPVNPSNIAPLKNDLSILTRLARKLRKDREEIGGAVDLSSGDQGSELKFILDENNNPTRVTPKKQMEIHQTIAEMMILANSWVAKTIFERTPDRALLRIHQSVEENRFEDLQEVLNAGKISFDGSSNMALADSLKAAEKSTKSNTLMSLFQSLATRAMSEAQYVCTGQAGGDRGLSHYGLGLEKYTHFTSPIRRYADVVVHKQLLEASENTNLEEPFIMDSQDVQRHGLQSLPASEAISILGGEGLRDVSDDAPIGDEEMPAISAHPAVDATAPQSIDTIAKGFTGPSEKECIYEPSNVTRICEGLNRQNRMAKISSFECQSLFLSLYFKDHTETTTAVVTNLRTNGLWVYVPRFDMRGPVYLSDFNGNLQVDPALLHLGPSAGLPPNLGFAGSGHARLFSSGSCELLASPEECLEVIVPESESRFRVRVLDVISVTICCDQWDIRARVPMPKLHLIAQSSSRLGALKNQASASTITSSTLTERSQRTPKGLPKRGMGLKASSLYEQILTLETPPVWPSVPLRTRSKQIKPETNGQPTMPGRLIFGKFRNPDTHSAKQEASIAEAAETALQRRNQIMANRARNNEYDSTQRIEKDVTNRMKRLAAGKRNTRKSKN